MSSGNYLLLLGGASNVQGLPCIQEAHHLGFKVLLVDTHENLSSFHGLSLADHTISIENFELDSTRKLLTTFPNILRVYSFREKLQFIASYLNRIIGCPWTSPSAIKTIQNKYLCRSVLSACGIYQPWNMLFQNKNELLEKAKNLASEKFILKPVGQAGSKGVLLYQGNNLTEIVEKISEEDLPYLIEEFVDGDEYSIEILICNHEYHLLGITKKYLFEGTFIEQGHVIPANELFGIKRVEEIYQLVKFSCQCLGLQHGMIHAEFWDNDGKIVLGEIHNRPGGDFISLMAAKVSGLQIYASQFSDQLISRDEKENYMAVWSNEYDAPIANVEKGSHPFYFSSLSHRNMFCTSGDSLEGALEHAKATTRQFCV